MVAGNYLTVNVTDAETDGSTDVWSEKASHIVTVC